MPTNPTRCLPALACVAFLLAGGCASHARSHAQASPQELTLHVGERAGVAGGALRYVRVVNDSRCPVDVQCVWAGDVELSFEFSEGDGPPRAFTLSLGHPTAPLGAHWIHLRAVARGLAPEATVRIDDERTDDAPDAPRP